MEPDVQNQQAKYASVQAMAEIGLGSVVHSLHIPLGGHLLSINQVICLCLGSRRELKRQAAVRNSLGMSTIVALLKLLSPAGKRVMPMLAIFMQGLLFSIGLSVVGANVLGAVVGAVLLSVWGFIQPLATAYLLFGATFFQAVQKFWNDLTQQLGVDPGVGVELVVMVVGLKAIASAIAAGVAWRSNSDFEARYLARVDRWWKKADAAKRAGTSREENARSLPAGPGWKTAALGALSDLCNPLFLGSLVLCVLFLKDEAWSFAGRTVVMTFALFFAIRAIPQETLRRTLARHPNLERAYRSIYPDS